MWKIFFEICDLLCTLVPSRRRREYIRRVKLFDWRRKYRALRAACPELRFRHVRMIKGGWNIGFIVDRQYVFKTRKFAGDVPHDKIMRESRITNAFADIVPLRIPRVQIVNAGEYTFYKYDFIPGRNLNRFSAKTIIKHRDDWGKALGKFIYVMHNARPRGIDDLRDRDGDGWNHNDICNNVIVDTRTMKIVGLIDWEYSGWGTLDTEITNCTAFSRKMRESGISDVIKQTYAAMSKRAH